VADAAHHQGRKFDVVHGDPAFGQKIGLTIRNCRLRLLTNA
jgi:hypothetical protein